MIRIAITGMGCISALGNNCPTFVKNLMAGVCGIETVTEYDTSRLLYHVAGEVKNYDPQMYFDKQHVTQMDRFAQFAVISAREAAIDSGLDFGGHLSSRTAVVHGTGSGGLVAFDAGSKQFYGDQAKRLYPFLVPRLMPSASSSQVSMDLGITGPVFGTTSACASAGHALIMGVMLLRSGMVDVAVVGGSEACLAPATVKSWEGLRVMAHDTCRPFSRGRGGMVLGEGAGTLVLERLDYAQERGAKIYAELAGASMNADAQSLVMPCQTRIEQAIHMALDDAGIKTDEVDYINAHGTGTAQNDATECAAIHGVFGTRGKSLPISSTKSMTGHALGGASALEAIATVAAIEKQMAPPTINYLGPDPHCDIDCVPNEKRAMKITHALSHSFAFGGLNTVLAFRNVIGD